MLLDVSLADNLIFSFYCVLNKAESLDFQGFRLCLVRENSVFSGEGVNRRDSFLREMLTIREAAEYFHMGGKKMLREISWAGSRWVALPQEFCGLFFCGFMSLSMVYWACHKETTRKPLKNQEKSRLSRWNYDMTKILFICHGTTSWRYRRARNCSASF